MQDVSMKYDGYMRYQYARFRYARCQFTRCCIYKISVCILLFGLIELDHQMPVSCGGYPRTPQKMLLLQAPEYGTTKVVGTIVGTPTDHVSMRLEPLLGGTCSHWPLI